MGGQLFLSAHSSGVVSIFYWHRHQLAGGIYLLLPKRNRRAFLLPASEMVQELKQLHYSNGGCKTDAASSRHFLNGSIAERILFGAKVITAKNATYFQAMWLVNAQQWVLKYLGVKYKERSRLSWPINYCLTTRWNSWLIGRRSKYARTINYRNFMSSSGMCSK